MKLNRDTVKYLRTLPASERRKFLEYLKDADMNIAAVENYLGSEDVLATLHENQLSDNPFGVNLVKEILDSDAD